MLFNMPDRSIYTKRLRIRAIERRDFDVLYQQYSDQDMCRYLGDPPCTESEVWSLLDQFLKQEETAQMRWVMEDKINNQFIGTFGFHHFDPLNGRVEIGYDVWKDYWQQGFMKEALPQLLDICFNELRVSVVFAMTHSDNRGSHKLLESFGFQCDGILRAWIKNAGKSQNQKVYSLLKTEFIQKNGAQAPFLGGR